jgi:hypothetical protein
MREQPPVAARIPRGPFTGSHALNVHAQRLKSEADAALLRNRLERLKMEESKALKKIADTRRRAEEITQLKVRNELRSREKRNQLVEQQRKMEEARHRVFLQKITLTGATESGRTKVVQNKRQIANQTRQERAHLDSKLAARRDREVQRARQIYSTIKEHETQARAPCPCRARRGFCHALRLTRTSRLPPTPLAIRHARPRHLAQATVSKMQERMMHEERLQAETQRKMLLEETKRREAEQLVHEMEASEEVLIERLRRTQDAQKLAYEELEQALSALSPRDAALREMREPLYNPYGGRSQAPPDPMATRLLMPPRSSSLPVTPRSPRTLNMYNTVAHPPGRSLSGSSGSASARSQPR